MSDKNFKIDIQRLWNSVEISFTFFDFYSLQGGPFKAKI